MLVLNNKYSILNSSGNFVSFLGIQQNTKEYGYKITLENDRSIVVTEDHMFLANDRNMYVSSLVPMVSYITTIDGDYYVKAIEKVSETDFYDIIDSENCEYFANGFSNHNCSFLGSGDNFIAEEYLKRIQEEEIITPLRQEYADLCMWIFEEYVPGEDYIMAMDVSAGHGDDYSTINMLKTKEIIENKIIIKNGVEKKVKIRKTRTEQVAEYYGKVTPQQLAEIGYQFGKRYNNAYAVIDITGGYGVQTVEKLIEFGYENIHYSEITHKPSRDRLQGYIKKGQKILSDGSIVTVDLIPGFFIGNNRASVLLEMQRAIHLEEVIVRSVRTLDELKTFITVPGNRVADHKRSFHDDSIMGLAIGLYALNFEMLRFKQSKGITEKMLNALIGSNDVQEKQRVNPSKYESMFKRPPNPNSVMGQYAQYGWLFAGLKGQK